MRPVGSKRQGDAKHNFLLFSPFSVVLPGALLDKSSVLNRFTHWGTCCVTLWPVEGTVFLMGGQSRNPSPQMLCILSFCLTFTTVSLQLPSKTSAVKFLPCLCYPEHSALFPWPTYWLCCRVHVEPWKCWSEALLEPGNVVYSNTDEIVQPGVLDSSLGSSSY